MIYGSIGLNAGSKIAPSASPFKAWVTHSNTLLLNRPAQKEIPHNKSKKHFLNGDGEKHIPYYSFKPPSHQH